MTCSVFGGTLNLAPSFKSGIVFLRLPTDYCMKFDIQQHFAPRLISVTALP